MKNFEMKSASFIPIWMKVYLTEDSSQPTKRRDVGSGGKEL